VSSIFGNHFTAGLVVDDVGAVALSRNLTNERKIPKGSGCRLETVKEERISFSALNHDCKSSQEHIFYTYIEHGFRAIYEVLTGHGGPHRQDV
jgi:hypothetical protein